MQMQSELFNTFLTVLSYFYDLLGKLHRGDNV